MGNLQETHEPGTRRPLCERLHDSQMDCTTFISATLPATFSLQERARADNSIRACAMSAEATGSQNRAHCPIIDELQERMAAKCTQFLALQSMPDARGIDRCSRFCR
ncbi:hypothetical protein ACLK1S_18115 [Escherichia coli]